MPLSQETYYKKPEETIEQYSARIEQARKDAGILTSSTLQPESPINLPNQPQDNTNYGGIIAAGTGAPSLSTTSSSDNWFQQYLQSNTTPESAMSEFEKMYQTAGISTKEEELAKAKADYAVIEAQLQGLQKEADYVPVRMQEQATGRGITVGGLAPIEAGELRKVALRALPLQYDALIAQAKVTGSQAAVDAANKKLELFWNVKSSDLDRQYEYKKEQRNAVYDYLTKKEQQKIDTLQKKDDRAYEEQQNRLKTLQDWQKTAITNGQTDLVSRFASLDTQSKTFEQDLAKITGQITPKAETIQLIQEVNGRKTLFTYDKQGKIISQTDLGAADVGGGGITDPSIEYYTQLLASGKITVSNVPQGIRNAVIAASQGNVNARLSDTAITKINDTEFAITSLNDLRAKIEGNINQIGPITGLEALNPWSTKRQLQADIDRVRQTVGKALEGGVLRKEDEEKYKKILATITDTPETALYKIDALISSIQGNIENYKQLQSEAGHYVGEQVSTPTPEELRTKYNY